MLKQGLLFGSEEIQAALLMKLNCVFVQCFVAIKAFFMIHFPVVLVGHLRLLCNFDNMLKVSPYGRFDLFSNFWKQYPATIPRGLTLQKMETDVCRYRVWYLPAS